MPLVMIYVVNTTELIHCDINFVSTFVIPAILLLLTYIYGIYLFWGKHEDLESLAGQVMSILIVCTLYLYCIYIVFTLCRCSYRVQI